MNESVTKKEIKNYSRDFRTIANRTINSDFDVFDGNLKRLINYIDKNTIISQFINSCKDKEEDFNIEEDVEKVSNGYGEYYFDSYIDEKTEVSYTYQILKYITKNNIKTIVKKLYNRYGRQTIIKKIGFKVQSFFRY